MYMYIEVYIVFFDWGILSLKIRNNKDIIIYLLVTHGFRNYIQYCKLRLLFIFVHLVWSQVMSSYATKGVRILLVGDGELCILNSFF